MDNNVSGVDLEELMKAREQLNQERGVETDPNMYKDYHAGGERLEQTQPAEEIKEEQIATQESNENITDTERDLTGYDAFKQFEIKDADKYVSQEVVEQPTQPETFENVEDQNTSTVDETEHDEEKADDIDEFFDNLMQTYGDEKTNVEENEQKTEPEISQTIDEPETTEPETVFDEENVREESFEEKVESFENNNNSFEEENLVSEIEQTSNFDNLIDEDLNNETTQIDNETENSQDEVSNFEEVDENDSISDRLNAAFDSDEESEPLNDEKIQEQDANLTGDLEFNSLLSDLEKVDDDTPVLTQETTDVEQSNNDDLGELIKDNEETFNLSQLDDSFDEKINENQENEQLASGEQTEEEHFVYDEPKIIENESVETETVTPETFETMAPVEPAPEESQKEEVPDFNKLREMLQQELDSIDSAAQSKLEEAKKEEESKFKTIENFKFIDEASTERFRESNKLSYIMGKNEKDEIVYGNFKEHFNLAVFGNDEQRVKELLNSLILSICLKNDNNDVNFVLLDANMDTSFEVYNKSSYLFFNRIAKTNPEICDTLAEVMGEVDKRYRELAKLDAKNIEQYNEVAKEVGIPTLPHIFVVFNNYTKTSQGAMSDRINSCLYNILKYGRIVGVFTVVASQEPITISQINYNLSSRIAFKSQDDSRYTIGYSGVEDLPDDNDVLYYNIASNSVEHLKVSTITKTELELIINNLED